MGDLEKFNKEKEGIAKEGQEPLMLKMLFTPHNPEKYNRKLWKKDVIINEQKVTLWVDFREKEKPAMWTSPKLPDLQMKMIGEFKAIKAIMAGQLDPKTWNPNETVTITNEQGGKEIIEMSMMPAEVPEGVQEEEKGKQEGKKVVKKKDEDKMEKKILNWEENKEIIIEHLKALGFVQSKTRDNLFVKTIDKANNIAIFCDFSKTPKGSFYCNKDINPKERNEYHAFRALQEGKGKINPEDTSQIIIGDAENQQILQIENVYEETEEKDIAVGIGGKTITLDPSLCTVIKGKRYPTIDAVVDAMQRAEVIQSWETDIIKYPEKILGEDDDDPEDIHSDKYLTVAKAKVSLINGKVFEGLGDAHPLSIQKSETSYNRNG